MDDKKKRKIPLLGLLILTLISPIAQAYATNTSNPGVIYHTLSGGGDLTFGTAFTFSQSYLSGNYRIWTDFTWGGANFGTIGFTVPAGASAAVTNVQPNEVVISITSAAPATQIGVYHPGKPDPTSTSALPDVNATATFTVLEVNVGAFTADIKWGGGGGGGGGPPPPETPPETPPGGGGNWTQPAIPVNPLPPLPDFRGLQNAGALFIIALILLAIVYAEIRQKRKGNRDKFKDRGRGSPKWKTGGRYE